MVTNQKEIYYKLGNWHLIEKYKTRGQLAGIVTYTHGWSPTIPRMVTPPQFEVPTLE